MSRPRAATLSPRQARASQLGLGFAFALLGSWLGASGCHGGLCRCPELEAIRIGNFLVTQSADRPELVDALVVSDPDAGVEVSFTRGDGSGWVVDYALERVTDRGTPATPRSSP